MEFMDVLKPHSFFDKVAATKALGVFMDNPYRYVGSIFLLDGVWFTRGGSNYRNIEECIHVGLLKDYGYYARAKDGPS